MSRIGKQEILIPAGVKVTQSGGVVTVAAGVGPDAGGSVVVGGN